MNRLDGGFRPISLMGKKALAVCAGYEFRVLMVGNEKWK